jgi:hypothetical protein
MSDLALEVDELIVQAIETGAQTEQQVQTYVNDRLCIHIPIEQINRIIHDFYGHYGQLPPSPLTID